MLLGVLTLQTTLLVKVTFRKAFTTASDMELQALSALGTTAHPSNELFEGIEKLTCQVYCLKPPPRKLTNRGGGFLPKVEHRQKNYLLQEEDYIRLFFVLTVEHWFGKVTEIVFYQLASVGRNKMKPPSQFYMQ